ncbi:cellulose biosynthesis cyclic di-GMP-binding regulatory protein BcsB, partial [Enterobacter sp. R1(2018)]|uniref:cellulose biosynthesis cyclic di-GMP-binding regulatory protein BcsB n=1 Tax=Enterobacter sp. R1(2018) TaxID=2447891 RepID=UPI00217E9EED
MKRMTRKACQMWLAFSVMAAPVMAAEPTTVESVLPVDLPPVTEAAPTTEPSPFTEAAPTNEPAPAPATEPSPITEAAPASEPAPAAANEPAPVNDATPASEPAPASVTEPAPVTEPVPAALTPSVFTPGNTSSITVAQMGQPLGVMLSGGQLQGGIDFTLSADQVVTNAQLLLNLKVSPAMAARNTTLQLMLNGQPLGTVPLGSADSNVSTYQLEIPAAMVVSRNNLSFKINDGDALLCQRDLSDKYQVTIMPTTRLDLEAQQLNIGADLSHFPRPFFDEMQMTPATMAFAFPAKTQPEQVGAAALIASWLGIQADYRGISFEALRDKLPEKNGILFGKPGETIGGLTLPKTQGPMLQIVDNPGNPVYKLLLVVGNND